MAVMSYEKEAKQAIAESVKFLYQHHGAVMEVFSRVVQPNGDVTRITLVDLPVFTIEVRVRPRRIDAHKEN